MVKQITIISFLIFIIIGCSEKKPDRYGVFITTTKGVVEIEISKKGEGENLGNKLLNLVKQPIVDKIKKISIRYPNADRMEIFFIESLEKIPTKILIPFKKKDIDWIVYTPAEEMKKGLYLISSGLSVWFPDSVADFASFFYASSTQQFDEFIGGLKEKLNEALEAVIKSNMYTFQVALADFAIGTAGIYPADLYVRTREIREDAFEDTTLLELLPDFFKNPVDSSIPPVVVSLFDPPLWDLIKPGQVVYVPLEIQGKGAARYKIYGKGPKGPINLILSSEF